MILRTRDHGYRSVRCVVLGNGRGYETAIRSVSRGSRMECPSVVGEAVVGNHKVRSS